MGVLVPVSQLLIRSNNNLDFKSIKLLNDGKDDYKSGQSGH